MSQPSRQPICFTEKTKYPHSLCVTLRYGDTDKQGHINNAVYCTLFESGRVAFLSDSQGQLGSSTRQFVIAKLTLDYIHELNFPGDAEVRSAVLSIGHTSFTVGQAIFKDGICNSTAETVIVLIDATTKKPVPIDDNLRTLLTGLAPINS